MKNLLCFFWTFTSAFFQQLQNEFHSKFVWNFMTESFCCFPEKRRAISYFTDIILEKWFISAITFWKIVRNHSRAFFSDCWLKQICQNKFHSKIHNTNNFISFFSRRSTQKTKCFQFRLLRSRICLGHENTLMQTTTRNEWEGEITEWKINELWQTILKSWGVWEGRDRRSLLDFYYCVPVA